MVYSHSACPTSTSWANPLAYLALATLLIQHHVVLYRGEAVLALDLNAPTVFWIRFVAVISDLAGTDLTPVRQAILSAFVLMEKGGRFDLPTLGTPFVRTVIHQNPLYLGGLP